MRRWWLAAVAAAVAVACTSVPASAAGADPSPSPSPEATLAPEPTSPVADPDPTEGATEPSPEPSADEQLSGAVLADGPLEAQGESEPVNGQAVEYINDVVSPVANGLYGAEPVIAPAPTAEVVEVTRAGTLDEQVETLPDQASEPSQSIVVGAAAPQLGDLASAVYGNDNALAQSSRPDLVSAALPRASVSDELEVAITSQLGEGDIPGAAFTADLKWSDEFDPEWVDVAFDTSGFANAYGGDYGDRLQLVIIPACALTTPELEGCLVAVPLETQHLSGDVLRAYVPVGGLDSITAQGRTGSSRLVDLGTGALLDDMAAARWLETGLPTGKTIVAAVAGASSQAGTFKATDLAPRGTWGVTEPAGGFTYSIPIAVPPVQAGGAPALALTYASQSTDGKTSASNSQAGVIGEGWSMPVSFIERLYKPCADDGESTAQHCWDSPYKPAMADNTGTREAAYVMSLQGNVEELVYQSASENGNEAYYVAASDPNLKVTRFFGDADRLAGDADDDDEYFKVETSDGSVFYFGYDPTGTAESVAWEPVRGNNAGEPGYGVNGNEVAKQAYRFYLDLAVDVNGNASTYFYEQATNKFRIGASDKKYIRDTQLARIEYGQRYSASTGGVDQAQAKVEFDLVNRCVEGSQFFDSLLTGDLVDDVKCTDDPSPAVAASYPDVPVDLLCPEEEVCTASQNAPVYFSTVRLDRINTFYFDEDQPEGEEWVPVESTQLITAFPTTNDGSARSLWLDSVYTRGWGSLASGDEVTTYLTKFSGIHLNNRVDWELEVDATVTPKRPLDRLRIDHVWTDLGGRIDVTYATAQQSPDAPVTAAVPGLTGTLGSFVCPQTGVDHEFYKDWAAVNPVDTKLNTAKNDQLCYVVKSGAETAIYHRYVVTSVVLNDLVGGQPPETHTYFYGGSPAHARADSLLYVVGGVGDTSTFSSYRGFASVSSAAGAITVDAPVADAAVVPVADIRSGDFNGDGRIDLFTVDSTGTWLMSSGGSGAWVYLNRDGSVPLADLRFGDFNGDGRTDVFSRTAAGQWRMSSAGAAPWVTLTSSGYPLAGYRFGDFNADGKTDVFNINVTQWQYVPGGTGNWTNLSTSSAAVTSLGFANVGGDGRTDVFVANTGTWSFVDGGAGNWQTWRSSAPAATINDLRFGNVNGGATDEVLLRSANGAWSYYSYGVANPVTMGGTSTALADATLTNSFVGDFTGDGKADLLMQEPSGARKIWRDGDAGWTTYVAAPGTPVSTAAMTTNQYYRGVGGTLTSLDDAVAVPIAETPTVAPADLRYGDFDGDKVTDLFTRDASGQWKFSSGGTGPWQNLGSDPNVALANLRFGDFNGDGKTDVFTRRSDGRWLVAWSGRGVWKESALDAGRLVSDLRFGDFDGDQKTDVFARTSAGTWHYSPGGVGSYVAIAIDGGTPLADLRFADFNGDKKTDVFSRASSGQWRYSPGGVGGYVNLNADATTTISQLRIADVTGDGKADVITQNANGTWKYSDAGVANWTSLTFPADAPQGSSEFQDMNGDGRADLVVALANGQRKYASPGSTQWTILMVAASTPGSNATASTRVELYQPLIRVDNDPRLQGVLESSRTVDAEGNVVSRSRQTYSFVSFGSAPTWDRTGAAVSAEHNPHVVQVTSSTSHSRDGAWSSTSVTTTMFDNPTSEPGHAATFQPTSVTSVTTDSRFPSEPERSCQNIAYAQATSPYLIVPVSAVSYDGGCGDAGVLTGKVEVGYDGGEPGASTQSLTRGMVTTERVYTTATDYTTSRAAYDDLGRIVQAWTPDASGPNDDPAMMWDYDPAEYEGEDEGFWITEVSRVLDEGGEPQRVSTTWTEPSHGNVVKTLGATSGDYTHYQYDALGLMVAGWAPAQHGLATTPSLASVFPTVFYRYDVYASVPSLRSTPVAITSAPFVRPSGTSFIGAPGASTTRRSITFLDGFGRAIEQHAVAPDGTGNAVVTVTRYNELGQVDWTSAPFVSEREVMVLRPSNGPDAGKTNLVNPTLASLATATDYTYDSLGRTTATTSLHQGAPIVVDGLPVTSSTTYEGPVTTSTAPDLSRTTVTVDTLGRTISQLVDADPATRAQPGYQGQTTTYAYDTVTTGLLANDPVAVPSAILTLLDEDRIGSQRVTVTDPEGNATVFESNLAGQRTLMVDPNAGAAAYDYDDNGRTVQVRSAAGTISMEYDVVGRLVERTTAKPGGGASSSATWDYVTKADIDANLAPAADLGLLHESVSTTRLADGTALETTQTTTYDALHRPVESTTKLPTSALLGDLSGTSYSTTMTYDALGQPTSTGYDELGNLPAETVTTGYRLSGVPRTLTVSSTGSTTPLVTNVAYTGTGQLLSRTYGNKVVRSYSWDVKTRALMGIAAEFPDLTATPDADGEYPWYAVQKESFVRDVMGRVTQSTNLVPVADGTAAAGQVSAECFTYDGFNRLAAAWTVAGATTPACGTSAPASSAASGWDASSTAYAQWWSYHDGGRIHTLTERVDGALVTQTFDYDDEAHPAAVTSTTGGADAGTFTYDAAGRMKTRNVTGLDDTSLTWEVTSSLVESTGQGGHVVYAYDASGQRVAQARKADANGAGGTATAYVASGQVEDLDTAVADPGALVGTRYYAFGGATVAIRTAPGAEGLALLLGDEQGSTSVMMPVHLDGDGTMLAATLADAAGSTRTAYTPFGELRGGADADNTATDRGWLGQVEDRVDGASGTGLTYLNARYYDPATMRFISPDPLMNPGDPKTLDRYRYADNNPVVFTDATGLTPTCFQTTSLTVNACLAKYESQNAATKTQRDRAKYFLDAVTDAIKRRAWLKDAKASNDVRALSQVGAGSRGGIAWLSDFDTLKRSATEASWRVARDERRANEGRWQNTFDDISLNSAFEQDAAMKTIWNEGADFYDKKGECSERKMECFVNADFDFGAITTGHTIKFGGDAAKWEYEEDKQNIGGHELSHVERFKDLGAPGFYVWYGASAVTGYIADFLTFHKVDPHDSITEEKIADINAGNYCEAWLWADC